MIEQTADTRIETMLAPFSPVRAAIEAAKAENAAKVFDLTTSTGEKEARSHIYSLRRMKGEIARVHKDTKAEVLAAGRRIDAVAKELTGHVEEMIDVHQKPLDELEAREAARKAAHEARLAELQLNPLEVFADAATVQAVIDRVNAIVVDDTWQEYQPQAATLQQATLRTLEQRHAALVKAEAEAAELARLRAEAAERDAKLKAEQSAREQAEREARIAAQAAEDARRKAEQEAADKLRAEKEAAEKALAAEREKTARAERDAEQAKRKAAEAEVARERKAKAEAAAEEERAANTRHRNAVKRKAVEAIMDVADVAGSHRGLVAAIIDAITDGKIPGVTIRF
jgi:hypothetical protein